MIFNSEDMEVDSVQITETDPAWTADSNGVYVNGYAGSFAAGDYHISLTFEKATAYQFSVVANIPEAVISNTSLTLTAGFTKTLSVKDNNGTVQWKSSKPSIATVDKKGKVTAKKAGKCTITASVDGKQLKCAVTVKNNKYTATKLTNSEISYGNASWEAYSAAYDDKGGLVIKFRMVNSSGHYSEYLKNIVVKVKTAKGSTVAVYKESQRQLYVADQSYKDFSITIPKSDLKIKKTVDLRNASIQTDGKFGYTYYTY
ncbi:MAG: Ig-like domain-containing protein [Eubacterium sp.]|nr:Ig-like domain-containing protein [Eubacterium sp.]